MKLLRVLSMNLVQRWSTADSLVGGRGLCSGT